jgi:hypothetical protein
MMLTTVKPQVPDNGRFIALNFFKVLKPQYLTSQSPTVSPRQQFPRSPKKKKLLESDFEN